MNRSLSWQSALVIGSMLFGLFFGAGNLIFPVHLGQEAGANLWSANLGFLTTAIGLPFLGIVAMGVSRSDGLIHMASRVTPTYAKIFTLLLYITIGPAFAIPRTATVSYQIGLAPFTGDANQTMGLAIFTAIYFLFAFAFALKPGKLLMWVGKVLNPLFLLFLAILLISALLSPMGAYDTHPAVNAYSTTPFFKGFTEGYNTMDALASLAFGILIIRALQGLHIEEPSAIAKGLLKAGLVTVVLMAVIYTFLAYVGATSLGVYELSANGGIALAQIANFYYGEVGAILLAITVTLACLKTCVGLISACSETFEEMFPQSVTYRAYAIALTLISFIISNVGLTQIIALAIPILMFLYPLTITLILLSLVGHFFNYNRTVFISTTTLAGIAAIGDALGTLPYGLASAPAVTSILQVFQLLPGFTMGMGWVTPALVGFVLSLVYATIRKEA